MENPFMNALCQKIDRLHAGASERLDRIDELPSSASKMIVNILLQEACQSQHVGAITSARRVMRTLPPLWLSSVLHAAIEETVDLDDEWEYRRLIELLKELKSGLLAYYLDYGLASGSSTIHDAATDLKNS
jgi:hypothetical protein